MKKLIIAIGLIATLNGCATITDTQATCQSSTYTFTDMVGCLNEQARKNPNLVSNGVSAEYLAYANVLAEQVTYRQTSDANARYQLALKLSEIRRQERERQDKVNVAIQKAAEENQRRSAEISREFQRSFNRPQPTTTTTTCTPRLGGGMECTTR